jgi:hypothetical protein
MNSNLENAYIAPEAQQEHDDETLSVKKRQLEDEISAYRTELMHITNDSLEELESIIDNEEERKRYIAMYKKLIAEKQAEISGLVGKKLSQEEVTHLEELELTIPILETAITDITDELASMDKNDPKYVKISTYLQELISELKLFTKNRDTLIERSIRVAKNSLSANHIDSQANIKSIIQDVEEGFKKEIQDEEIEANSGRKGTFTEQISGVRSNSTKTAQELAQDTSDNAIA